MTLRCIDLRRDSLAWQLAEYNTSCIVTFSNLGPGTYIIALLVNSDLFRFKLIGVLFCAKTVLTVTLDKAIFSFKYKSNSLKIMMNSNIIVYNDQYCGYNLFFQYNELEFLSEERYIRLCVNTNRYTIIHLFTVVDIYLKTPFITI